MNPPSAVDSGLDEIAELDAIEEMRLRVWARQNYASVDRRDLGWHPVILDEMACRDRELNSLT